MRSRGVCGASAFMTVPVCLGDSMIGQCNETSLSVNEAQELSAYLSEVLGCDNVPDRHYRGGDRTRLQALQRGRRTAGDDARGACSARGKASGALYRAPHDCHQPVKSYLVPIRIFGSTVLRIEEFVWLRRRTDVVNLAEAPSICSHCRVASVDHTIPNCSKRIDVVSIRRRQRLKHIVGNPRVGPVD